MTQANFEQLLKETIGLDPSSIGSTAINSAIRSRMSVLGIQDIEQYWKQAVACDNELQELIDAVIVPETWFFRDEEAFSTLARVALREWLSANATAVFQCLSWPCCTGEEPYSMVMALLDAGFEPHRLHVQAVDISNRVLSRAKRGLYGKNSFRTERLGFRDRHFQATVDGYRISDSIREAVSFRQGNLLGSDAHIDSTKYDVIFCRNVLIYFDCQVQERVLRRLRSLLAPRGLLFVGASEAFLASGNGFKLIGESMSFAFRADQQDALPNPLPSTPRPGRMFVGSPAQAGISPNTTREPAPADSSLEVLDSVKVLADAGRLSEASDLCESYLKENATATQALYLLGVIRDALGDPERASQCYRKVLYLDPEHVDGLIHLALLLEQQGDRVGATRLRQRARQKEVVAR